jgi:hypothetical protein
MNERIKQLAARSNFGHMENGEVVYDHRLEKFAELIVDDCCVKLLDMDSRANGNHNYYKHAAIELKRYFRED